MLLVAAPQLLEDNFRRTVVFVIHHREQGTLGVVLNRPSEIAVHDVLPEWGSYASEPQSLFVGGPVEQRTAICLAAFQTGEDVEALSGVVGVRGPVGLVDLESDPGGLMTRTRGMRFFAGYAGWEPEQLAGEIDRGDWIVVPSLPDDVIAVPAGNLWGRVLRRQGTPLAFLATHPGDVQLN
ncbi:putative transcriptional regulator [Halopolyspora algeriensis]|uniref:Putative transcriptional regulator n=2 Tax=Halopolyspora algeriensis TaxID=1500506 RepID=A0A368W0Q4_9ACTN|nr:putative transcriptional regulator [Halopolyspora algeriensis]TQM48297.1 putative transcriptional regulator [Halopolyspora algeriensis]